MKKYFIYNKYLLLFVCFIVVSSCSKEEKLINSIDGTNTAGAILRTKSINSENFNYTDTSSQWSITVEEQDHQNGNLLDHVNVLATHTTNDITSAEVLIKAIPASAFSTGPNNLPVGTISATLQEVLTKLNLVSGDYTANDKFTIRLELILTDGRSFSSTNSAPSISQSYFNSPFTYIAQFSCPITDASLFDGTYSVVVDDWADYVAGDPVPVVSVAGTYKFRIMSTNDAYISNSGTSYMEVTIDPTDNSVTVQSNEDFIYPGFATLAVTGTGSVGTCTGDINLKLDLGWFMKYSFSKN